MLKTAPKRSLAALAIMALFAVTSSVSATELVDQQSPVSAGKNVYQTVYGPKSDSVYVAAAGGEQGEIHVFQGHSLTAKPVITMQDKPLGLAIDEQDNVLFTGNTFNGSVTKIDLNSGKVLANLVVSQPAPKGTPRDQMPPMVHGVLFQAKGDVIYVTGAAKNGVVWKVDAKSFKVVDTIKGVGAVPTGMALDESTDLLYVTAHSSNQLTVIDTNTDKVVKTISVGQNPLSVAINSQSHQAYVANSKDNTVSVIDLSNDKTVQVISVGQFPVDVNVDAAMNRLFVANRSSGTVQVFNTKNFTLEETLHPGLHPNTLAIDTVHHQAYVTSKGLSRHEKTMPEGIVNNAADVITPLTK